VVLEPGHVAAGALGLIEHEHPGERALPPAVDLAERPFRAGDEPGIREERLELRGVICADRDRRGVQPDRLPRDAGEGVGRDHSRAGGFGPARREQEASDDPEDGPGPACHR
jgi:hypothetical protein